MRRAIRAAAVVAAGLALAGCGSEGRLAEGDGDVGQGKELFTARCGYCHVLADAGTNGQVGPNLDEAFRYVRNEEIDHQGFEDSTIREVVRGQISYPVEQPVTDQQGMPNIDETLPKCKAENEPAGCVENQDEAADAIAAYVASVAGVEGAGEGGGQAGGGQAGGGQAGGGQGGGGTDGESIFSANCATCHTLGAADASGTIGPNLDEAKPSSGLVVTRVREGKGAMPSFEGRLSDAQIRAVAQFVSQSAGG